MSEMPIDLDRYDEPVRFAEQRYDAYPRSDGREVAVVDGDELVCVLFESEIEQMSNLLEENDE